jgi:hypothetical protein
LGGERVASEIISRATLADGIVLVFRESRHCAVPRTVLEWEVHLAGEDGIGATPLYEGSIKWDGCVNLGPEGCATHLCGERGAKEFASVLLALHEHARKLLGEHCH